MNKNNLQKLFARRESQFKHVSGRIEKELSHNVIPACLEYLTLVHAEATERTTWTAFGLAEYGPDNKEAVSVYGQALYVAGEEYTDPVGNYIVSLTPIQAEYLSSVFQVIIPMDLAETGTQQEIFEFLKTEDEKAKEMMSQSQDEGTVVFEDPDFDLDGFDEDQILLSKLSAKRNGNIIQ